MINDINILYCVINSNILYRIMSLGMMDSEIKNNQIEP